MFPSVRSNFIWFSTIEGRVNYMYLDIKGLVTTAEGILIDPIQTALSYPWTHKDGSPASRNDIIMEWRKIKLHQELAQQGHRAAKNLATLFLSEAAMNKMILDKFDSFAKILKNYFPKIDEFPADAQLGIMSMAWAMGPGFAPKFPNFTKHCNELDFEEASFECLMNTKNNAGLVPRNHANVKLFESASYVMEENLNLENIYGIELPEVSGEQS